MLLSSELEIQFIHLIILENDKSNHTLISEHKRRHYCGSLGKISWNNDRGCNNPRCVSLSKMLCPDVTSHLSTWKSPKSLQLSFAPVLLNTVYKQQSSMVNTRRSFIKKGWNNGICSNVDEARDDLPEWRQTVEDKAHMVSLPCAILKKGYKYKPICRTETDHRFKKS